MHAEGLQQIQDDAGIEGTRPRSHRHAIEAAEAKRTFDTLAVAERAQAGAAAEVRDDDPLRLRRILRQRSRDELIG